jgi:hypothetical protein
MRLRRDSLRCDARSGSPDVVAVAVAVADAVVDGADDVISAVLVVTGGGKPGIAVGVCFGWAPAPSPVLGTVIVGRPRSTGVVAATGDVFVGDIFGWRSTRVAVFVVDVFGGRAPDVAVFVGDFFGGCPTDVAAAGRFFGRSAEVAAFTGGFFVAPGFAAATAGGRGAGAGAGAAAGVAVGRVAATIPIRRKRVIASRTRNARVSPVG